MSPSQPFDPFAATSVKLTFIDSARKRHSSKPISSGLSCLSLCRPCDVLDAASPIITALRREFTAQARALLQGSEQAEDDTPNVQLSGTSQNMEVPLLFDFTLGAILGRRVQALQSGQPEREFSAAGTSCERGVICITFSTSKDNISCGPGPSGCRGQGKRELPKKVCCYHGQDIKQSMACTTLHLN